MLFCTVESLYHMNSTISDRISFKSDEITVKDLEIYKQKMFIIKHSLKRFEKLSLY